MYNIISYGKNAVRTLVDLGITKRKSYTLDVNFSITRGFILGVIDGDGDVHYKKTHVRITSASELFVNKLKEHFDNLNIYCVIRKESNYFRLLFERKPEVKKLYDYLYQDWDCFCLDYKRINMLNSYVFNKIKAEGFEKSEQELNEFLEKYYKKS